MVRLELRKTLSGAKGNIDLNLSSQLEKGSFNAIYGPSGVGKTSILRMLAGLMNPDEGIIEVDGKYWFNSQQRVNLRPQNRNVGIVFQDYGLFPEMTVEQNIRFALAKGEDDKIVNTLIEMMSLGSLTKRKPLLLSGGQKQRVALARTLVQKPKLLLLDEPLTALGREMRADIQKHIKNIHNMFNLTTILVSHSIKEVIRLSDHIIKIDSEGLIVQGGPAEVFETTNYEGNLNLKLRVHGVEMKEERCYITVLINGELRTFLHSGERPRQGDYIEISFASALSQ